MKLSLTFEPFVKPQYKDFCVNKIQETVAEIKHHFKFSLKENIYQHEAHVKSAENKVNITKPTVNDNPYTDIFSKTIKKEPLKRTTHRQQQDDDLHSTTQNIKFFHLLQNKQLPIKPTSSSRLQQPSQQLIQQQELVGFLQKVESALGNHTTFYQTIMEKIQLMNQKQLKLEKIIEKLKGIQKNKARAESTDHFFEESGQLVNNLDYMTFRDRLFISGQNSQSEIQESGYRSTRKRKTAKFQSDSDEQPITSVIQKPNQNQIFASKLSSRKRPSAPNQQNYYLSPYQDKQDEQIDLDGISQNADFLISFMKLEQQFNKIKRKSQFKKPENPPKTFNKYLKGQDLQHNSKIQFNYAH